MGKGKQVEANVATTKRKFSRGSSSKTNVGLSKLNRQVKKKEMGKTPKQNNGKKAAEKGKCYHCGQNGYWLRNCPKYLAEKKAEKEAQEGKITLKAGTGEMVSAKAVEELKLYFGNRYIILKNVLYGHVYLICHKSNSLEMFKKYKAEVENEIEHEIQSQLSAPNTPQHNGVSERRIRTFLNMVCSMMSFAQLPDSFSGYALEIVVHILNNVPSKSVSETPYELWKWRKES
ncbi:gag/pol protein [Cucumis melo var. makuwa]|uniref:Gag/pol protein n=1 Tax=Cucumis melo var. makuwa TaxID=1194695 RepID=A0A5D3DV02_CUCMM|nr:gag/pol protein [Cucumis melo var. makuwa]